MDFRVTFNRYSAIHGNRSRTEFLNTLSIEDAVSQASLMCRCWEEMDPDHSYFIVGVILHTHAATDEASMGWQTSEEWTEHRRA